MKKNPVIEHSNICKKNFIRAYYREQLFLLSPTRRAAALAQLSQFLIDTARSLPFVLSFASLPQEINLWKFNELLAKENKLVLPRVEGCKIKFYFVNNISTQLTPSKSCILEPIAHLCTPFLEKTIPCILVPALAFDSAHHRIGHGKGHYDQFLSQVDAVKMGVGFKEQLSKNSFPSEPHDIPMDHLLLF